MKLESHRVQSANGYLELIREQGASRFIAHITDYYYLGPDWYVGIYGIHEVIGRTVSDVKVELFRLIMSGQ